MILCRIVNFEQFQRIATMLLLHIVFHIKHFSVSVIQKRKRNDVN